MASNFYNFAREEISSVPTFKDLDSHNEKVTIERRHKSWKKHIDHMTLRVKSKRRVSVLVKNPNDLTSQIRFRILVKKLSQRYKQSSP